MTPDAVRLPDQRPDSSVAVYSELYPPPARPGPVAETRIRTIAARLAGDAGAVLVGLAVASQATTSDPAASIGISGPGPLAPFSLLVILLWLTVFAGSGLYDQRRLTSGGEELKLVLHASAAGIIAAAFTAYLFRIPTTRGWILLSWAACAATVVLTRLAYRSVLHWLRASGRLVQPMLIVGAGREGQDLYRTLRGARGLGFEVVGFLDDDIVSSPVATGTPQVIDSTKAVRRVVQEHGIGALLIAGGSVEKETAERVYKDLQGMPVDLYLSTGLLGIAAGRCAVHRFGSAPVVGLRRVELTGVQQTLKRMFDLLLASLALLVLLPVLAVCSIAVLCSGPGPVLFRQQRIGLGGREFTIHKFRSMVADAERKLVELTEHNEADGLLFKLAHDPRVTRVGRFLRAWSLDELPQLFDVVRGHMSLVGPRPPLPDEVSRYDAELRNRLRVKPGLTGLWQVSGRHRLSFEDYVRYDLFYVENWSLAMDLYILLRTIPAVLRRSGA